jgi:ABC-2 type transport system permease protein
MANVLHLGVKELRSLLRDPVMLVLIGWAFTGSVYAASTAVPETLNKAPIGIVDQDRSALSIRLVDAFHPPHFLRPVLITPADMDARMDAGAETFALNIPPGFQRDVLAGRSPALQLNVDATRMSQAFTGSAYIQTIVTTEVEAFLQGRRSGTAPPVDLVLRTRFNPNLTKAWFTAAVQVINQVTLLSIVLTGAALIREREHGTIEHLLVMPVTPLQIMLSKVWSMGVVVLAPRGRPCCWWSRGSCAYCLVSRSNARHSSAKARISRTIWGDRYIPWAMRASTAGRAAGTRPFRSAIKTTASVPMRGSPVRARSASPADHR